MSEGLVLDGFTSEMKLELFTLSRNSILMRVENIGDMFDSDYELIWETVDIAGVADQLFTSVNGALPYQAQIKELSLTGNQSYEEMSAKRIKWKTWDDHVVEPPSPAPHPELVQLQQQRIRVF